jgi:hypothetical protein
MTERYQSSHKGPGKGELSFRGGNLRGGRVILTWLPSLPLVHRHHGIDRGNLDDMQRLVSIEYG